MKLLFTLFAFFSFSALATCPKGPYTGEEAWKLRENDVVRELHHCKMTSSQGLKQLEFCVGRISSSYKVEDYIGVGGILEYAEPELSGRVFATKGAWISLKNDKEGKAEDSSLLMSYVYRPTPSIMASIQERYSFSMDKRSGSAFYQIERKDHPCFFCGGWKVYKAASLRCKQIQ
jgi:hypothetical protein